MQKKTIKGFILKTLGEKDVSLREVVIYLSGKYTVGNVDENIQKARKKAIELWELGFTVITPHLNTVHFEMDCKCKYDDYLTGDLEILRRCDAIYMLEGWGDSPGAREELKYAEENNLIVIYEELITK